MVEIRLHGALARDFGRVWNLAVESIPEAVQAIEANMKGFAKRILDLQQSGMVFRVRSKNHDFTDTDVSVKLGSIDRIDIIPVVSGASAGLRFVTGALLIASTFLPGPQMGNPFIRSFGASLMLGAVTEWLSPVPKKEDQNESLNSWTASGPINTAEQGLPVPIVYGEVLAGGYTISAGLSVAQLTPGGSVGPDAEIGGNFNPVVWTSLGGSYTAVLNFSVGEFNMSEPHTYDWSTTGFAGTTVKITGDGTASAKISITVLDLVDNSENVFNGTVSCQVTGFRPNTTAGGAPVQVSATDTKNVELTINSFGYTDTGGGA